MVKKYFLACMLGCGFVNAQIFSENFNSGTALPTGWTTTNTASPQQWEVGNLAFYTFFSNNVAFFDDDHAGDGSDNSQAMITSPVINLANFPNAKLNFKYCNYIFFSDTTIKVEVFNGTNWVEVFTHTGEMFNLDANSDEILTQVSDIDLSSYINANFKVRFVYNDLSNWSFGCAIDDVIISNGNLGTSELVSIKKNIEIFPSVVSDVLNLKSASKIIKVHVFDTVGRKIDVKLDENKVDVRNLITGNYIIFIETAEGKVSKKFIKK